MFCLFHRNTSYRIFLAKLLVYDMLMFGSDRNFSTGFGVKCAWSRPCQIYFAVHFINKVKVLFLAVKSNKVYFTILIHW